MDYPKYSIFIKKEGGGVRGSAAEGRNLMPPTAAFENLRFPVKLISKNNIYIKQYKYYTLIIINNVLCE